MVKQTLQRGFTLIELLVVIAIIGILAAVVLTSLGGAQEGAQNSNIKNTLSSVASAAQLVYNEDNFTYENVCTELEGTGGVLADLEASIGYINSTDGDSNNDITCNDTTTAWAVSAPLIKDGNIGGANTSEGYWCIDSSGTREETDSDVSGTTC